MIYTRSAIVTGGTINVGYYAALEIARHHPDWLVVVCSGSHRERAAEKNTTLKQNNTVFMPLDLNDTKKVRSFANEWISRSPSSNPSIASASQSRLKISGQDDLDL